MPFARNKNIRVMISQEPGGPIQFGLQQVTGSAPKNRVSFHNQGHPGVMIYFNISDPDNTGLRFQPVPTNAIWAAPSQVGWPAPPNCPANAPPPWSELVPLTVEEDGQQLIVYFRNTNDDVHFPFALRFVGPNGPENYDPIGDGHNGPRV